MSSVAQILQAMAENAGRRELSRGALIGNTVAGAAQVPAQIIEDRTRDALLKRQQAIQDEQVGFQRNADARATSDQAMQEHAAYLATAKGAALRTALAAGFGESTDPKQFDEAKAIKAATDAGYPELAQTITETHKSLMPQFMERTPGSALSDKSTGAIVPGSQVPFKPEAITEAQLDQQAQNILAKPEAQRTPEEAAQISAYQQRKDGDQVVTIKTMENGKPVEKVMKKADALKQGVFQSQPPASMTINPATIPSGDALDMAARRYLATGELPSMGMGTAGAAARVAVMSAAAKIDPQASLTANKATYKADSANLTKLQTTEGTLSAFEKTAGKNLDQFLSLAEKIPDTGVPWLNLPIRVVNDKALGSADQAAFHAARDVALREIARVTNDPKLSGSLTDSARAEVAGLSPRDATFAQIQSVAKVLKQDMANVHSGINEQIGVVKAALQGHPGASPMSTSADDPLGIRK